MKLYDYLRKNLKNKSHPKVMDSNSFTCSTGTDLLAIKKKKSLMHNDRPTHGPLWTSSGMARPFKARHQKFMGFRDPPMY